MTRLTKRILLGDGKSTVDFSNECVGEYITDHAQGVKALFLKLADYEDNQEKMLEYIDKLSHRDTACQLIAEDLKRFLVE